jgi:pyruvate,water dikinase
VPAGFTVSTDAYREFVRMGGLAEVISTCLSGLDHSDLEKLELATAEVRAAFLAAEVAPTLEATLTAAYDGLGGTHVAVRSSGTAEDLAEASFAGQHDTYLDVHGAGDVLDAVRRC